VEAVIDFADDESIEEQVYHDVAPKVDELQHSIEQHLDDGGIGERIREGCKMGELPPRFTSPR
jgi:tRNA U34 5-carboxymethylaminomethyl modifying GTPase MnmE/TrmE